MIAFIDDHRGAHGVEPICQVLPDRPLDLPRPRGQTARSRQAVDVRQAGRRTEDRGSARLRSKLFPLRRAQGLAPAQARRLRCCPLHGVATYAEHGFARVIHGKPIKTTISDKMRHACWITSIARSRRQGRTFSGSPTSPMSRPGRVLSTSPLSSTPMPAGLWAGEPRARRMQLRARCAGAGTARSTAGPSWRARAPQRQRQPIRIH